MGGPRVTIEKFISRAKDMHGERYDYSKLIYGSFHKKLIIICKIHGEFLQTPGHHLMGKGCRGCVGLTLRKALTETNEGFIEKARKIHYNRYDYSKVEYINNRTKVIITCKDHGDFLQRPDNHLFKKGCAKCGLKESLGERKIKQWCESNNIKYEQEKKFIGLLGGKNIPYRFDFYFIDYNLLIEYDGEQHFNLNKKSNYYKFTEKSLKATQKRDLIKSGWAKNNNIELLRISYIDYKNIDVILNNKLLGVACG